MRGILADARRAGAAQGLGILPRMDERCARYLARLNEEFYRLHHDSFSNTRQAPWPGWERSCRLVMDGLRQDATLRVLDLACGNLRFERFLLGFCPDTAFRIDALDSSRELAAHGEDLLEAGVVRFIEADLTEPLPSNAVACRESYDLAVCFGFMHHVPGFDRRLRMLEGMLAALRPGGFAVVSFWQFTNDGRQAEKVRQAHERLLPRLDAACRAQLEKGDFLLGWQHDQDALRYCHDASDEELDALLAGLGRRFPGLRLAARFKSDGRSDDSNAYLVLRRD